MTSTARPVGAPGTSAAAGPTRPRWWVAPLGLFVVVFAVDLACPSGMTADSIRAVGVAVSMVHWHTISLDHLRPLPDPGYAVTVAHGHLYPYFPWAVSLFAVPWVVVWDVAHKLGLGTGSVALVRSTHDWDLQIVTVATTVAAAAVFVRATALRLLASLGRHRRRWALLVACAFVFSSPVWSTAGRSLWQQGPSVLCLSAALYFAVRARAGERGWAGMGAAAAAAYAVRPTDSIVLAVLLVWVALAHRRRLPATLAGAAGPLAVLFTVNVVAYGHLFTPYQTSGQGFAVSGTMAQALAGNLVSPARGLLWYCPLVLLAGAGVWFRIRDGAFTPFWRALSAMPVLHWVVISAFKHWWGGDSYGPRLFTDMIPVFTVLALPAVERLARRAPRRAHARVRAGAGPAAPTPPPEAGAGGMPSAPRWLAVVAVAALGWGGFVNAQGAVLRSAWCWNSEPLNVDVHPSTLWSFSDPQFLRGIRRLVFGPDRSTELIRDGVDLYGCPTEPVRP